MVRECDQSIIVVVLGDLNPTRVVEWVERVLGGLERWLVS